MVCYLTVNYENFQIIMSYIINDQKCQMCLHLGSLNVMLFCIFRKLKYISILWPLSAITTVIMVDNYQLLLKLITSIITQLFKLVLDRDPHFHDIFLLLLLLLLLLSLLGDPNDLRITYCVSSIFRWSEDYLRITYCVCSIFFCFFCFFVCFFPPNFVRRLSQ